MTAAPAEQPITAGRASFGARIWNAVLATWGAFTGVLPHVLHHVGPLAGAAILAGVGGRLLFFALGLVAAIPLLRRLHRRFRTWIAPATAVAAFAVMFTLSTLLVAPLLGGSDTNTKQPPEVQKPSGHAGHHAK